MFDVTGTTVITPRPSLAAVALAASLLTMTAGRRLFPPSRVRDRDQPNGCHRAGSRTESIAGRQFPEVGLALSRPFLPRRSVARAGFCRAKQAHGSMESGRSRLEPLRLGVFVEELDVRAGQADTDLHTAILPLVGCG